MSDQNKSDCNNHLSPQNVSIKNGATGESRDCGGQPQTARSGGHTEAFLESVNIEEAGTFSGDEGGRESPEASRGTGRTGAPPSNTAPANCISEDNYPITVLRNGIDSLYLSYPRSLGFNPSLELTILKQQARSEDELEQAEAVYKLPGHIFSVNGKGSGLYPFVLSDNAYRIQLSGMEAKKLPLAYVQIKSDWLVLRSVLGAVAELDVIIEQFGCYEDEQIQANVSRADLFVDFVSAFPFDELPVAAWVSRAKRISTHTISRTFTGYSFGLGGDLSARLYNKTEELKESKKDYLKKLWLDKGWDGESTVWRLEFQFKRPVLTEHEAGSVEELLAKLSSLWRYSCTS